MLFKKSEDTRTGIVSDFGLFKKRTGIWLHEAKKKDLSEYFLKLIKEGRLSQTTMSRYKGTFSAFFQWLQAKEIRDDNPGIELKLIQLDSPQGKPKALSADRKSVV